MVFCDIKHQLENRSLCSQRKQQRALQITGWLSQLQTWSELTSTTIPSYAMAQKARSFSCKRLAENDSLRRNDRSTPHSNFKADMHRLSVCQLGKHARTKVPKEATFHASKILDLVHSDVCSPFKTCSTGGAKYFITITDDLSRKV